jgi:hypothetical protein
MLGKDRLAAVFVASLMLLTPLPAAAEPASPSPGPDSATVPAKSVPLPSVPAGSRNELLGYAWEKSRDRAVVATGDASGFHVLVADAKDGYRWRTAASLSEPGFDTDAWIGNVCVTASGNRAVVVYAPRTFTNKAILGERGGFTAIVDLVGRKVRKLPIQTSLAYFNPGCGPTESAILTQEGAESLGKTRLLNLDTATGRLAAPIDVPGQLTSAVPTSEGIVAADAGRLVRVNSSGRRTLVAPTKGVPYRVTADADGGVVYVERHSATTAVVRRVALSGTGQGSVTALATGAVSDVSVRSGRGGQVYVTGANATRAASAPVSVRLADLPKDARVSLSGGIVVTSVLRTHAQDPRVAPPDPLSPQRVNIGAVSLATGKSFSLSVVPSASASEGAQPSPALRVSGAAVGSPTDPADGDQRYCSVSRNDPRNQAMQPKPRQVEWAVDQAVRGTLAVQRPANWKNLGMPAYTPQGMFPSVPLDGGGNVPAQVMLGISAQESNMWQASRFAVPGVTANPLIGNYFGIDYYNDNESDDWVIRWDKADCGYGVMQITDGMRLAGKEKEGERALPYDQQRAIALDFVANVAKGLRMLQEKWNQTRRANLILNDGAANRIENWFVAVWAYNSGFYPDKGDGQPWGVGWLNNPVNPRYPADRQPFLEMTYEDAAHPQHWPYPEKVMGWAGHPIELIETPGNLVHGYRAAWWLTDNDRANVKPPLTLFCDASNQCHPNETHVPNAPDVIGEPAGPCAHKNGAGLYDLKCWYHQPATWKPNCQDSCGRELLRFDPGYAYQDDAASYPPNCGLNGLPNNARVIDNLPRSVPSVRPNCSMSFTNAGTFTFSFLSDIAGNYPGKVDVHQLGTGFGGQFWMSNTIADSPRRAMGTWTFSQSAGWARVLVHLPAVGARTQQARYQIDVNGNGTYTKDRYLNQEIQRNGWVSLGVYQFKGVPRIRLSNITKDGKGTVRVAWDAVALQPLPGKPRHVVAALGDSYSSGEGAGNYAAESNANHGTQWWNACRRSRDAYTRKVVLPGDIVSLGSHVDQFGVSHELGFVACSGATTTSAAGWAPPPSWSSPDDYEKGEGQFHEVAQIDSGVLDENTTLVTLTMGGNDERMFSGAIEKCGVPIVDCTFDSSFVPSTKAIIDRTTGRLDALLRLIASRAPNARIVLLSYPVAVRVLGGCPAAFTVDEALDLSEIVTYFADKQRELADSLRANAAIKVYAATSISEFAGHAACDSSNWIHFIRWGPIGEGDFHSGDKPSLFCIPWPETCVSRESFHPTQDGTSAYSRVLRQKLVEIGY